MHGARCECSIPSIVAGNSHILKIDLLKKNFANLNVTYLQRLSIRKHDTQQHRKNQATSRIKNHPRINSMPGSSMGSRDSLLSYSCKASSYVCSAALQIVWKGLKPLWHVSRSCISLICQHLLEVAERPRRKVQSPTQNRLTSASMLIIVPDMPEACDTNKVNFVRAGKVQRGELSQCLVTSHYPIAEPASRVIQKETMFLQIALLSCTHENLPHCNCVMLAYRTYQQLFNCDLQRIRRLHNVKYFVLDILNNQLWALPTGKPHPQQVFEELVDVYLQFLRFCLPNSNAADQRFTVMCLLMVLIPQSCHIYV